MSRIFDLDAELRSFPSLFGPEYGELRARLGLPNDLMLFIATLGIGRIKTHGDFYEPDEFGDEALIFAVHDGSSPSFVAPVDPPRQIVDLIAIPLAQPGRWSLRTGIADVLGADRIAAAMTWGSPLRLYRNPLSWLRGCCEGACLLDDNAAWRLLSVPDVIYDNIGHARRTGRLLRRPPATFPKSWVATDCPP